MSHALVLDPSLTFPQIETALQSLGFARDPSVRPATPNIIAGEPELAAWRRDGERLTYTFNPVVSLRTLAVNGLDARQTATLAARLPLLDTTAVGELLTAAEPRRILLGLFAARTLKAGELLLVVAPLQAHPDPTISRTAASTLSVLRSAGATPRQQTLVVMRILCRRAIPVLAALVGPDGPSVLESMRPRAEDYVRVFREDIIDRVRSSYEVLWRTPPQIDRLVAGEIKLKVNAAPAGMFRDENELSRHFPGGYQALAPYLVPDRVWFVWRYLDGPVETGMRYDGVVLLDERWVWFPKPYKIVGEILYR